MPNCPLKEAAKEAPNLTAILAERSISFKELDEEADRIVSTLSIKPGALISLYRSPTPSLIALFFALWRLEASVCPLNLRLPAEQIYSQIKRLPTDFPQKSLFLFTSGSTGTPKIACLSLDNLIQSAANAIGPLDLRAGDEWLLSLPLFHVGGMGILFRCILARATIVMNQSPNITHLSYVPTQLYRSTPVYKKLRCLLLGGAPILSYPEELPVYATYGLTEMSSLVTLRKSAPKIGGHYFLGHPLQGREVRLAPDGEIFVRGRCLFQGYWENGKLATLPEWFPTGDIGRYDPIEGLAIVGRKDWQFISGGENIQPEEIEQELQLLPQVQEAAVFPMPDAEFGMRPVAAVSLRAPLSLQEMQSALLQKLPKYKIPTALYPVDALPKNGLKIDRNKLRRESTQGLVRGDPILDP